MWPNPVHDDDNDADEVGCRKITSYFNVAEYETLFSSFFLFLLGRQLSRGSTLRENSDMLKSNAAFETDEKSSRSKHVCMEDLLRRERQEIDLALKLSLESSQADTKVNEAQ